MKLLPIRKAVKTNFVNNKINTFKMRFLVLASIVLVAVSGAVAFSSNSTAASLGDLLFGGASFGDALASLSKNDDSKKDGQTSRLLEPASDSPTGELIRARSGHTATRLDDGKVLIVGGDAGGTAEILDSATGASSSARSLSVARSGHTATKLSDGRVLITGGFSDGKAVASTEIYDNGVFVPGLNLNAARAGHTATVLADGRILIVGGDAGGTAEIVDAAAQGSETIAARLDAPRAFHSAALLKSGDMLIVGGSAEDGSGVQSGEILDLETMTFSAASGALHSARIRPTLRELPDGKVQIIGGNDEGSMEMFTPDGNYFSAYAHVIPGRNAEESFAFKHRGAKAGIFNLNDASEATAAESEVMRTATRAALVNHGEASDSLLNRSDYALVEIPGSNQVLIIGGRDGEGEILETVVNVLDSTATITTDKLDYQPGDRVIITGSGFEPGETVQLRLVRDPVFPNNPNGITFSSVADAAGNFVNTDYLVTQDDLDTSFVLTAVGQSSGRTAQTTFTDGISNLDVAQAWYPTNPGATRFSVLVRVTGATPDRRCVRITVPSGYTNVSLADFKVGVTGWSSVVNGNVIRLSTLSGGNPLTPSTASAWARFEIDATPPANETSATWTSQIGNSPNGTSNCEGSLTTDSQIVRTGAALGRTFSADFRDGSGSVVSETGIAGTPKTYRFRISNTSGGGGDDAEYATIALPTCFSAPSLISVTTSNGGGESFTVGSSSGNVIRLTGGKLRKDKNPDDYVQVQFTTTPSNSCPGAFRSTLWKSKDSTTDFADVFSISGTQPAVAVTSGNAAPVASNVTISGTAQFGQTLTGNYTYGDADSDLQGTSTFRWLRNGTAISGATNINYTAVSADVGATLTFEVTPVALTGTSPGTAVQSTGRTINKANLTVTAQDASREYGDANPAFGVLFGGFVSGETLATSGVTGAPSCTTTATATSAASPPTYAITCTAGTLAAANYSFNFVSGNLTVTKATLTVSAANASRDYGDANPTFAPQYTGFKNSETAAALTTAPTCASAATAASPASPPTYAIVCSGGVSGNYNFNYVNGALTINKAALTVTANDKNRAYGAVNPSFDVMISGFKNGETLGTSGVNGSPACSTTATATSPASPPTYPISCSAGTLAATNYTFGFVNGALTVTKANLTVTAENKSRSYGAANPPFTYSIGGFVNGENAATANVTGSPSLTTTATAASAVGNYAITAATGTLAAPNYNFLTANGNLEITAAVLTVSADNLSKNYGDANPALSYSLSGFVNNENAASAGVTGSPALSTTAATNSAVGNYPITVNSVGTLAAANYSFAASATNGTLAINARAITVTANSGQSKVYGDADPPLTYTITNGSLVNGDSFSGSLTRASGESVGAYAIQKGSLALSANYVLTFVGANLSITPKAASVTPNAASKIYGDTDPAFTGTLSGFLAADGVTASYSRTAGETVGGNPYAISAVLSATGDLNNYTITYSTANFDINKRNASVTSAANGKIYGDADPMLTGTLAGFVAADGVSASYSRTAGETVGTYTISAVLSPSGVLGNYNITYNTANFDISKKSASVSPSASGKTYGDVEPTLTGMLSGFLAADGVSAAYSRTTGESVGTYTISAVLSPAGVLGNYDITYNTAAFVISKKAASVTPDAANKIYGDIDPAFSGTLVGFLAADGVSATYNRTTGETVGGNPYTISAMLNATGDLNNYQITYNTAAFNINKKTASVTPNAASKTYGNADPAFTGTLNNFLAADGVTATYSRTAGETAAGSPYTISASLSPVGVLGNYDITYNTANFTINKKALTGSITAASKVYDGTTVATILTRTLTGVVSGDVVSYVGGTATFADNNVGTGKLVTAVGLGLSGADAGNYSVNSTATTNANITRAALSVVAANKSRNYGEANPPLTGTMTGVQNGDAITVVYTTTATPASLIGNYPIVPNLQDPNNRLGNYNVTITNGILSVLNNAYLLAIDAESISKGTPPNNFSSSAVNEDLASIGQRRALRYFAANINQEIDLFTGQVGDEGWFALKTIPQSWATAGPTASGLQNFVLAGPGLGTPNSSGNREALLENVANVTPLRASGLRMLVGKRVFAVVYKSDVSINYGPLKGSLKGDNLGVVALEVVSVTARSNGSSSLLPKVRVKILDANVFNKDLNLLLTTAPAPVSSSMPFDVIP